MSLDALLDAQRAAQWAEARAARERAAEVVRAHPAGHLGGCPASSGGFVTRGEVEGLGGTIWHLDADEDRPDWWPVTGYVVPPDTPDAIARQRAARVVELQDAAEADKAGARAALGSG